MWNHPCAAALLCKLYLQCLSMFWVVACCCYFTWYTANVLCSVGCCAFGMEFSFHWSGALMTFLLWRIFEVPNQWTADPSAKTLMYWCQLSMIVVLFCWQHFCLYMLAIIAAWICLVVFAIVEAPFCTDIGQWWRQVNNSCCYIAQSHIGMSGSFPLVSCFELVVTACTVWLPVQFESWCQR